MSNLNPMLTATIDNYFQGTYRADAGLLRDAFHPAARICGFIGEQYVDMSLDEFVERVCHAGADSLHTKKYDKKIISMDIQDTIAVVKAKVLVDETYFIDFINLVLQDGRWFIRHKAFVSVCQC